jgi:long-chain acyl-CoA synthetase
MKHSRWVSQAVMYADRRPFPVMLVTLDEEQVVPWAEEQGIEDPGTPALARHGQVREPIQEELDRKNEKYARVEQVKRFYMLDHDLSQETGELTPALELNRNAVCEMHASELAALHQDAG